MKFENNNKEIVKRITNRSLKTNKIRNIFAILAIILTTFMISSVFSIGFSFAKNYKTMNLRLQGTTATIVLPNPSEAQIDKIKSLDVLSSFGSEINAGRVDLDSLTENRTQISIKYYDKDNFEKQITPSISDIKGSYPTEENEVMASRKALEFLGKSDIKLGDKIEVPCRINGQKVNKEFILKGIYIDYGMVQDSGNLLVSEKFIESNNLSLEQNGRLSMTVKTANKYDIKDILDKEIELRERQEFMYNYDANEDLGSTVLITVALVVMIALFIVFSGYLLIYNVLYIAVTKDINFYGLLKTIGTSPSQIKKIVRTQALKLSVVGIPLGLMLGAIVSFGIVPLVMETFFVGTTATAMPRDVSFNPIIFIAAMLFSLLTVLLSCNKPAKIAGNISPTEAMRYTGTKAKKQKKNRKSTNGGKLYKMAWYNVFREKKRAILVFLSLFMGVITFLSVSTFIKSISVENYIDKYLKNDFTITSLLEEDGTLKNKYDDNLIDTIRAMEGVKNVNIIKATNLQLEMNEDVLLPSLIESYNNFEGSDAGAYDFINSLKDNPELLTASVMGIDDNLIERVNNELEEKIDIEEFKNGNLILLNSWYYGDNYKDIKGTLTIKSKDNSSQVTFKVKVIEDKSNLIGIGLPAPLGISEIYMSDAALQKLDSNANNVQMYVNCDEKYEPQINTELKNIANRRGLWFESKSESVEDFKKSQMVMNILGGGISVILILIGILNFINVMITGVNIRLKEFAVMESIGMTKKQIKKVLTLEGFYYAGLTSLFICTIGVGIIYLVSIMSKSVANYAVFIFPTAQLITLIITIFAICLITPSIVFKVSSKKSVTERIREIEN